MTILESDNATLPRFTATHAYRYYVLGIMLLLGAFAWIDRQILSIVLQSIKVEFSFSDTQLGLIGGSAFGLFYATVAIPVAWLADRLNRRAIISISICIWSVMTALCSLVTGFTGLFLARMGVGIGEAGASPPAQSMLSDYFPAERRGWIMGLLYSYVPISYLVSFGLGGWVNDEIGWRKAFVVFGIPGVLLAALVHITVREPPRGYSETVAPRSKETAPPGLFEALRYILRRPTLRRLPFAGAAHAIGMVGASVWMPSYFIRVHHMTSAAIGIRLALIMGLGGLLGTLSGGFFADRLSKARGERWYAGFCAIAILTTLPFTVAIYLSDDPSIALLLFIVPSILNHMVLGPTFATVQNLTNIRHRALAAACYLFVVNLISLGFGPVLIGFLSDYLKVRYGDDGLRYSLLFLITLASGCAGLFYIASARTLENDLQRVTEHD